MFLGSAWNTNFLLLSKWKGKAVGLSVFHDKEIGLLFLVLGGKSGNQEQGQVSGCPPSFRQPVANAHISRASKKMSLGYWPAQTVWTALLCFLGEKKTWAKEVGDVDLRHEPDTEWAKGPLNNLI